AKKQAEETEMQKWIEKDVKHQAEYGNLLKDLNQAYSSTLELSKAKTYLQESLVRASTFLNLTNRYRSVLNNALKKGENTMLDPNSEEVKQMLKNCAQFYKNYDERVERDVLAVTLRYYIQNVPQNYWHPESVEILTKFNGNAKMIADYVFDNSIFKNEGTFQNAFSEPVLATKYNTDPAFLVNKSTSIIPFNEEEKKLLGDLDPYRLRNTYAKALYEFRQSQNKLQAPDANMTMRMSYGRVGGFKPTDGVQCASQTTMQGYFDKANPTNYEFNFSPRLKELFEKRDFGRWGENGVLYINFLSDNDITGGNSGSPVFNADGHLIGLAFDGNYESLAGDVHYENGYNKSVCVDIRYVMWVIEKYANAGYLLTEMKFNK
ncbi:MAG: S46 family peptidase, partial [Bacteroidales bacterium]|nr:S46 family peptidase [Bacteroidales bacterium]